jgi:SAM-dependent methyltransferase
MEVPDHIFAGAARVLDVGGWFKPEARATHVLDLMPWETRGARLSLSALPGERFSKATWHQADFLKPGLRLPFPDKSFDLVVCGHTIEDLADPAALLGEMQRVGVRGLIECPSRITEQTKGMRDRESSLPGHPHHHWIVESVGGVLELYSKSDSDLGDEKRLLPLSFTEERLHAGKAAGIVVHAWENEIAWRFIQGDACRRRAEEFVRGLDVSWSIRAKDRALRGARRMRTRFRGGPPDDPAWWDRIVELSQPYSSLELRPQRDSSPPPSDAAH